MPNTWLSQHRHVHVGKQRLYVHNRATRGGSDHIQNLSGDSDDEMDSWANRTSVYDGCMYGGFDGGGDKQDMPRNDDDDNVAPWNSDEVSSWRTEGGC